MKPFVAFAALIGALSLGQAARAASEIETWTYNFVGNTTGPVDWTAEIIANSADPNQITVELTSNALLPAALVADTQEISAAFINFSAAEPMPTLLSQAGALIDISSKTSPYTPVAGAPSSWSLTTVNPSLPAGTIPYANTITLAAAGGTHHGTPQNLIVNTLPSGDDIYTKANGSITGVHNPEIQGTGTFVISMSNIVSLLQDNRITIEHLSLGYGTQPPSSGIEDMGTPTVTIDGAVPEPATWFMMLLGVGCAGASMRRRRSTLALS